MNPQQYYGVGQNTLRSPASGRNEKPLRWDPALPA
jgi:hypothetical protein